MLSTSKQRLEPDWDQDTAPEASQFNDREYSMEVIHSESDEDIGFGDDRTELT